MKVSFGIVNYNRLFYLKSCLESIVDCTFDYPNTEIIDVDNASVEEGTDEYNDAVAECQEKAASTIANIGYATIGVVGLLAFLVIVPMFKGKGDDEEESDEDEGDDEE